MARRKSSRYSAGQRSSRITTSGSRRSAKRKTQVKPLGRSYVTDTMVEAIAQEVVDRLALEDIGVKPQELVEVLRPIVESIADQYSSRPSKDQILNRILRHQEKLLEVIAAYILESRDELNEAQLEFVIYNASGSLLARHVRRLYAEARRLGRDDLIDVLRGKWLESGVATPYQCPYCGFYALTPEFVCIVCGAEIDEREYKEYIGFRELLEQFIEEADVEELGEVLAEKRIVYDGSILLPPSRGQRGMMLLSLGPEEVKMVEKAYREKKGDGLYGA